MNQTIIQGVGYVALILIALSFQNNKRHTLLLFMLSGILLFVVHYILLGAWLGALMNLIGAAMVLVSSKKDSAPWAMRKFWFYLFILLFAIVGIATSKTLIDFLPVLAQIIGTFAIWQTNPRTIRFLMLIPRPLWFLYNLMVGSYPGMFTEVFVFLSVIVGIVRFDILKKTK